MTLLWVSVLVVAVLVAGWWLLQPSGPSINEPLTPEMLRAVLEMLLYQGLDGAELHVAQRDGPIALRFVKSVPRAGSASLAATLVYTEGTKETFGAFTSELRARGIHHEEHSGSTPVLVIPLDQDLGQAQFLTVLCFERASHLRLDRDCIAYFNDKVLPIASPRLTGVRRPV